MTTTTHPRLLAAERVLYRAADLLEGEGFSRREGARYGIPEALAEAAAEDAVALVLAERQCVSHGVDVWWNDLLCVDGDDAAETLRSLGTIDPAALYGERWPAHVGLFALAAGLTKGQLNGLGNLMHAEEWEAYAECLELARAYDRERLLIAVTEDVHFVTAHHATTPAGVQRRLKAIRALECVGAYHVLSDLLNIDIARTLTRPVARMLLPYELNL